MNSQDFVEVITLLCQELYTRQPLHYKVR